MSTPASESQQQILFELSTTVGDTRPVFIAGNFNDWKVADPEYQLQAVGDGKYHLRLPKKNLPETIEYKYTRGSWDTVELDQDGKERLNRTTTPEETELRDIVPQWMSSGLIFRDKYLPQIEIIDETFAIPQLIRTRRIAALLPHDYHETDKHYPVLYLQDGQNLFDEYAPFGNWAVDKRLAALSEQGKGNIIIIAIDHAKEKRIAEFTPSYTTRLGRGEGKKYARFLADTLKPYIDKEFRTRPEAEFTGIGGSSMGGLISIYAAMMYPEVYGRLMVFSPSLWVTPNIPFRLINLTEEYHGRVYLYGGKKESNTMVPNLHRFRDALSQNRSNAKPEFMLSIDPEGEHNEARWGEEFPKAIKWLFFPESS